MEFGEAKKGEGPNLFVVGAMKCGSASLHNYLEAHPDIFMCEPREPTYFLSDESLSVVYPELLSEPFSRDREEYLNLFAHGNGLKYSGESSTSYAKMPTTEGTAQRIAEFCPDARIIFLARNPVKRTLSHHWHRVRAARRDMSLLRELKEYNLYHEICDYVLQLEPYYQSFPAENIKIIISEELRMDKVGTMREVFTWLGLEDIQGEISQTMEDHVTPENIKIVVGGKGVRIFTKSWLWGKLSPRIPRFIKHLARRLVERQIDTRDSTPKEAISFLVEKYEMNIEEFEKLLGRNLDVWRTENDVLKK